MTTLNDTLASLMQSLDEDHWQIAFALEGLSTSAPRDEELAALYEAITCGELPGMLFDLAEDHAEAVYRHTQWAMESRRRHITSAAVRPSQVEQDYHLPLAS